MGQLCWCRHSARHLERGLQSGLRVWGLIDKCFVVVGRGCDNASILIVLCSNNNFAAGSCKACCCCCLLCTESPVERTVCLTLFLYVEPFVVVVFLSVWSELLQTHFPFAFVVERVIADNSKCLLLLWLQSLPLLFCSPAVVVVGWWCFHYLCIWCRCCSWQLFHVLVVVHVDVYFSVHRVVYVNNAIVFVVFWVIYRFVCFCSCCSAAAAAAENSCSRVGIHFVIVGSVRVALRTHSLCICSGKVYNCRCCCEVGWCYD